MKELTALRGTHSQTKGYDREQGFTLNLFISKNNRYRGESPRGRVPGNINNYDHNILELSNRLPVKNDKTDAPLFESIRIPIHKHSKSQSIV